MQKEGRKEKERGVERKTESQSDICRKKDTVKKKKQTE